MVKCTMFVGGMIFSPVASLILLMFCLDGGYMSGSDHHTIVGLTTGSIRVYIYGDDTYNLPD